MDKQAVVMDSGCMRDEGNELFAAKGQMFCISCCESRKHEGADLSSIPAGMFAAALEGAELAEAGLVDKPLFLALPQEIFVLFGERSQVHVLTRVLIDNVLGIDLHSLAVSEQAGPEGGPVRMEDLLLRYVRTA